MAWQVYKVLRRDPHSPTSVRYDTQSKGRAFRFGELAFPISHQEERELSQKYQEGSQPYELIWLVERPGGSVFDRTHAVRFFDAPSAVLWQLSRERTLERPESKSLLSRMNKIQISPLTVSLEDYQKIWEACEKPKAPSQKLVDLVKKMQER